MMTANHQSTYVEATVHLLRNQQALDRLPVGYATSPKEYSVENMMHRFSDDIQSALSLSENRK